MSYVSLHFLIFISITIALYYVLPLGKRRWLVLLAASYYFYLSAGARYIGYILFTTIIVYISALLIGRIQESAKRERKSHPEWDRAQKKAAKAAAKRKSRAVLITALITGFGVLAVLKYGSFTISLLNAFTSRFGMQLPQLRFILPLGISFYTFQAMGYLIDCYNGTVKPEKNFLKIALFVSFFPQILQGPISFYDQLAEQLYAPHRFDFKRFKYGAELCLYGYFIKLVLADRAAVTIKAFVKAGYEGFSGTTILFVVLLYSLQLYADFAGGIDISRGIAQILGIDMPINFRQPYFATSINDYWRRWHITLGAWLKKYIFYPVAVTKPFLAMPAAIRKTRFGKTQLGDHMAKVFPATVATMIVFIVVGAWHGAGMKFIAYGIYNGGIIMISMLFEPVFKGWMKTLHIQEKSFGMHVFRIVRTYLLALVGYVPDLAQSCRGWAGMMVRMFTDNNIARAKDEIWGTLGLQTFDLWVILFVFADMFVVGVLREARPKESLRARIDAKPFPLECVLVAACLVTVLVFGIYGPGFSPTQFLYVQY